VLLRSFGCGATEYRVGFAHGNNDSNLYRLTPGNIYIAFLDVEKEYVPPDLVQPVRVPLDL